MSNEDKRIERAFVETNPAFSPRLRDYFKAVNTALVGGTGWRTTTTTTTSTTSTTSSTSSTSSSTSSSTTTTTA